MRLRHVLSHLLLYHYTVYIFYRNTLLLMVCTGVFERKHFTKGFVLLVDIFHIRKAHSFHLFCKRITHCKHFFSSAFFSKALDECINKIKENASDASMSGPSALYIYSNCICGHNILLIPQKCYIKCALSKQILWPLVCNVVASRRSEFLLWKFQGNPTWKFV